MSNVLEINKNQFSGEVLESEQPVLVDFWAPWCMPCRLMSPALDELANDLEHRLKIVKVNTEEPENQSLAMEYQIQSIPNLKLFKKGEVVAEFVGLRSKDSLKADLAAWL
jgi:thioredoxin 1